MIGHCEWGWICLQYFEIRFDGTRPMLLSPFALHPTRVLYGTGFSINPLSVTWYCTVRPLRSRHVAFLSFISHCITFLYLFILTTLWKFHPHTINKPMLTPTPLFNKSFLHFSSFLHFFLLNYFLYLWIYLLFSIIL